MNLRPNLGAYKIDSRYIINIATANKLNLMYVKTDHKKPYLNHIAPVVVITKVIKMYSNISTRLIFALVIYTNLVNPIRYRLSLIIYNPIHAFIFLLTLKVNHIPIGEFSLAVQQVNFCCFINLPDSTSLIAVQYGS